MTPAEKLYEGMTHVSIVLALGNAARSAASCAAMCRAAKPPKPEAAVAQDRLAKEMWDRADWWALRAVGVDVKEAA